MQLRNRRGNMLALSAVLLVVLAVGELPGFIAVSVDASLQPDALPERLAVPASESVGWTAEQVRRWAADSSTGASLLDAERRSLASGLDRKDADSAVQTGLMQSVLGHLAAHERNRAAGEALGLYYRIAGIQVQAELAAEARQVLRSLLEMAERAEVLELPDGNAHELRGRLLDLRDQLVRLEYGGRTARLRLARLTGQPTDQADSVALLDPLPRELAVQSTAGALETALQNRGDLRAAEALCRCLSEDSLPAARTMMSLIRPGLGLAAVATGRGALLGRLHAGRDGLSELDCRRQQCRLLQDSIRESIRDEVATAELTLWQAGERVALAAQREELAITAAEEAESAVRLDQATPGSERLATLDALRLAGETIERRVELALADVQLRQAQGILSR